MQVKTGGDPAKQRGVNVGEEMGKRSSIEV
jgi:hypothetical protein